MQGNCELSTTRQGADGAGTPSCPNSSRPQHQVAPASVSAQECAPPVATEAKASVMTVTATLSLFPATLAAILAVPLPTAVTTPLDETVATSIALLDQLNPGAGIAPPAPS